VKEVINSQQDKKGFLRKAKKATARVGMLVALTACEQPQITDGTVFQKEHIKRDVAFFGSNKWGDSVETDREIVSMPPTREERSLFSKEMISSHLNHREEIWKVYIAQCPTNELPPPEKIKKECKTESFEVPQEVYPTFKLGQHANFKQPK
jgi:hypothetical protein